MLGVDVCPPVEEIEMIAGNHEGRVFGEADVDDMGGAPAESDGLKFPFNTLHGITPAKDGFGLRAQGQHSARQAVRTRRSRYRSLPRVPNPLFQPYRRLDKKRPRSVERGLRIRDRRNDRVSPSGS